MMKKSDCYYASADEMEKLDRIAVESGLEVMQMMELAGWHMLGVFKRMRIKKSSHIAIVVGPGNKGGDGLAAARHLINHGYNVQLILMTAKVKTDAKHHLRLAETTNTPIWYWNKESSRCVRILGMADVIIDALIGYHLEGTPRNQYRDVIEGINMQKAKIISYDLPTGVDPTTGIPTAVSIKAFATLTLALPKKLFETKKGRKVSGRIFLADIGIPAILYDQIQARCRPNFRGGMIEL